MGVFNAIAANLSDRGELVRRLADMAGILREARTARAARPVLCLDACDPHHWRTWGPALVCCSCGTRPVGADVWHAVLVAALRSTAAPETALTGGMAKSGANWRENWRKTGAHWGHGEKWRKLARKLAENQRFHPGRITMKTLFDALYLEPGELLVLAITAADAAALGLPGERHTHRIELSCDEVGQFTASVADLDLDGDCATASTAAAAIIAAIETANCDGE